MKIVSWIYVADPQCQPLHHLCHQISRPNLYRYVRHVEDVHAGCRHELYQQGRKRDWQTRRIVMGPTCSLGIWQATFVVIRDVRLGYLHVSCLLSHGITRAHLVSSENGVVCPRENELSREEAVKDDFRIDYLSSYADTIATKISEGVPVKSYLMWAWTDNFECTLL